MSTRVNVVLPAERIEPSIWLIRGQKVVLDSDLATLYGVETFYLNKAVKRNVDRFPEDFMFQLTEQEVKALTFQIGISKGRGGRRTLPYAFTEQGIAMLSGVLNSKRAIEVNIAIMRAFVKMRELMQSQEVVHREIQALKRKYKDHDEKINAIFLMIDEIIAPPLPAKKRRIGFLREGEE